MTLPDGVPLPPTRRRRRRIVVLTWLVVAVAAVFGAAIYAAVSADPSRAVMSYLGALVLVVVILEVGSANVRVANRIAPQLSLIAAVASYVMTVVALGLVLAVSSPGVVDGAGAAVGLVTGLVIWTTGLVARSWVRTERPVPPVSILTHDESLPTRRR